MGVSWREDGGGRARSVRKKGVMRSFAEGVRPRHGTPVDFLRSLSGEKKACLAIPWETSSDSPNIAQSASGKRGAFPETARRIRARGKTRSKILFDLRRKGEGLAATGENPLPKTEKKRGSGEKPARKVPFVEPDAGGVLTPPSPILTFSSSIPQRRPRPEKVAGSCRGRSLQKICSSGGMASFPPASRGSVSPGRGRVGALRASWRAG